MKGPVSAADTSTNQPLEEPYCTHAQMLLLSIKSASICEALELNYTGFCSLVARFNTMSELVPLTIPRLVFLQCRPGLGV